MSGYLTRIVQRAMESAPRVHANASLPFFPSPEPLPADEPPPMKFDAQLQPVNRALASVQAPVPPIEIQRRPTAPKAFREDSPATPVSARAPEHPPASVQMPAAHVLVAPSPKDRETDEPPPRTATTAAPLHRNAARVSFSAPHRPRAAAAPPAINTRAPLPAQAVASLRPTSAAAGHTGARDAPDVHIHIGRIELTAVPEAPPPARKPASRKKPMSLDEYLQGRAKR